MSEGIRVLELRYIPPLASSFACRIGFKVLKNECLLATHIGGQSGLVNWPWSCSGRIRRNFNTQLVVTWKNDVRFSLEGHLSKVRGADLLLLRLARTLATTTEAFLLRLLGHINRTHLIHHGRWPPCKPAATAPPLPLPPFPLPFPPLPFPE